MKTREIVAAVDLCGTNLRRAAVLSLFEKLSARIDEKIEGRI